MSVSSKDRILVIKFRKNYGLSHADDMKEFIMKEYSSELDKLDLDLKAVEIQRLFPLEPFESKKLADEETESNSTDKPFKYQSYFKIFVPLTEDYITYMEKLPLLSIIENVSYYGEDGTPDFHPENNPAMFFQDYLKPAPIGINALYAWQSNGGKGQDQNVIDIESGWTLNHQDLKSGISIIAGDNTGNRSHGTNVLGVLCAQHNDRDCIGIAHQLSNIRCISKNYGTNSNVPDAIRRAIAELSSGDILLLEAHKYAKIGSVKYWFPAEVFQQEFSLIKEATDKGIIVIEPAGNGMVQGEEEEGIGGIDLDLDAHRLIRGLATHSLNRTRPEYLDSGAIMVGGSSSTYPHNRISYLNFGSRVDCYAYGENVCTLDSIKLDATTDTYSTRGYTTNFNGTSSAAAIIAGAVIAIQGIYEKKYHHKLNPSQIRSILRDPFNGTPSANPIEDKIGQMPDLREIIDNLREV